MSEGVNENFITSLLSGETRKFMKKFSEYLLLIFLIFIFISFRFYHLTDSLNFGTDQGLGLLETYNLYNDRKITLIAQTGLSWTAGGRYIFFGSLPYYIYLPVLILGHWDPIPISYLFIFLQLVSLTLFSLALIYYLKNKVLAAFNFFIFSVTPLAVYHSQFLWTPNLLIDVSLLVLTLMVIFIKDKKRKIFWGFILGLVSGIGFYTHPSFLLVSFAVFIFIYIVYRKMKPLLLSFLGFTVGVSPLVIFDLRHDFYNLKTIVYIFSGTLNKAGMPSVGLDYHEFLPLLPFVIFLTSIIISKIFKYNKKFPILLLSAFFISCLSIVFPKPANGYTMAAGWNYRGESKVRDIILAENKKGYNIVDLLTGDTRGMALRYLLTISGKPPLGVIEYNATDYLFVYSRDPIEKILKGSLWEIESVKPVEVSRKWEIQNGINLYLLNRKKITSN